MTDALLDVRDLTVTYGGVTAVSGVSFTVGPGQIVTIVGPNGAGKTSLLNAVMGVVRSDGAINFAGQAMGRMPVETRVWCGLGLVAERRELFSTMTVEDNLLLGGFCHRRTRAARLAKFQQVLSLFPRLEERRRQVAGTLSGGERQMLAMGRALMGDARLLMLDEPSLGLAPLIMRDIFTIIDNLRQSGAAILLVEQNARAALSLADYGYVMERGKVVLEGQTSILRSDTKVIESYLGVTAATRSV